MKGIAVGPVYMAAELDAAAAGIPRADRHGQHVSVAEGLSKPGHHLHAAVPDRRRRIDSTGTGVLVGVWHRVRATDASLALAAPSRQASNAPVMAAGRVATSSTRPPTSTAPPGIIDSQSLPIVYAQVASAYRRSRNTARRTG